MHKRLPYSLATATLLLLAATGQAQTTSFSTPGLSNYTVPASGYYRFSLTGADGGDGGSGGGGGAPAGNGATVTGTYFLNAGDQLTFMIGARGLEGGYSGGGGGGTGLILNGTTVLLAAGAGGGSGGGGNSGYGGQGFTTTAGGGNASGNAGGGGGFNVAGSVNTCTGSGGGSATLTTIGAKGVACTGFDGGAGFGGGGSGGGSNVCGGGGGYAGGNAGTRGGGGYSYYYPTGSSDVSVTPGTTGGSGYSSDLNGTASVTPVLTTGTITGGPFLPGAAFGVPFTAGISFNAANVFTAQLSDASGSFANPTAIGSLAGTASGSINVTLPAALRTGSGYRIRIAASDPVYTSSISAALTVIEPANALNLNGTSDYVASGSSLGISGTQARTLEYFGTINGAYEHQANWGTALTNQAFGTFTFNNSLFFYAHDANDFNTGFTADGLNHHVAITYDGTHVRVYVDGTLTSAGAVARTLNTSNTPLYIGARMDGVANMSGIIDEVRVWNRALCAAEILQNATKALAAPEKQSGLVLNYRFNQGQAAGTNTGMTTAFDSSFSANHGSLANTALSGSSSNYVASTFSNTQVAAYPVPAVTAAGTITQTMRGSTLFANGCNAIAQLLPSGSSAVAGAVTAQVSIDGTVQSYLGNAYVQRHYDVTPAVNSNTATGFLTLYFTQGEFDAYNLANGTDPDLPSGPSDLSGISNLRVTQFHGTSATAVPGSYSGYTGTDPAALIIRPASVTWSATASHWEVRFPVNGFSGFFVAGRGLSGAVALPVHLTSFSAVREAGRNRLDWTAAGEPAGSSYGVERSSDGQRFMRLADVAGKQQTGAYVFHDTDPLPGTSYYRLSISEAGRESFSRIVSVSAGVAGSVRVTPVPTGGSVRIVAQNAAAVGKPATIADMQGREILRFTLQPDQDLDLRSWPAGIYSLRLSDGTAVRIVKQ